MGNQRVPKRRYKCIRCGEFYTARTHYPVPKEDRLCHPCRRKKGAEHE